MAKEIKRGGKSEVLSMRMDPTTRFLVDFIARVRGQSISTVVDRAIQETADRLSFEGDSLSEGWAKFWHVNEGVRSLKMWSEKGLYPTYEEQTIVSFSKIHWPFFYINEKQTIYREGYIDIIWPKINEFVEIWRNTKTTNYFAAGKAMREAILAAGVQPPDWPQKSPEKSVSPPSVNKGRGSDQMDDDIPF